MSTDRIEIHTCPEGSVYGDGSRGYPVRDLHSALRLVRQRRARGQRAVVWLTGGTYRQRETLDLNLFWDTAPINGAVRAANSVRTTNPAGGVNVEITEAFDEEWRAAGRDLHSLNADPQFVDLQARNFRVQENSPASTLGIQVPDVSGVGPRPLIHRLHPLAARTRPDQFARARG